MTPAILIEDLAKSYGGNPVVRGVSLEVPAGHVLGLLGPNGAGKTTTVKMVSTLIKPDRGRALVCGYDVVRQAREVRALIGLTGQYASVDEDISGWENLYVICRLFNLPRRKARTRADEMLERFGLTEAGARPVGGYSGGMRRRLDLAASLVGDPRVLCLDEPTTGLDPHSRNALWAEVRRLADLGTTVLLTTQYMEEAEALADSLVVIDRGQVIARGKTAELRSRLGGQVLRIRPEQPMDAAALRRALENRGHTTAAADEETGQIRLPLSGDGAQLTDVVRAVGQSDIPLAGLDVHIPSLDEVFLTLTGADRAPRAQSEALPARSVV
ncbi:ATP-binding cassette domain-containing protein [Streptomyces sp. ISL-99]|uniref:ATP-binding cassette domain-containing protein n=1 Tax=Streptomyces sp. ISL-99 TaxID=2819193 RepID=UPI001BE89591|nr:ATP-binding cassette domain-containing protein [Streptomyces sp. ISL-99]MBT2526881.1 ATP-binding cassette domain-containing protein [Streptomyces sp. ISL-99]